MKLGKEVKVVRCDIYDRLELQVVEMVSSETTLFNEKGFIVSPITTPNEIITILKEKVDLTDGERIALQDLKAILQFAEQKKYDWIFFPID